MIAETALITKVAINPIHPLRSNRWWSVRGRGAEYGSGAGLGCSSSDGEDMADRIKDRGRWKNVEREVRAFFLTPGSRHLIADSRRLRRRHHTSAAARDALAAEGVRSGHYFAFSRIIRRGVVSSEGFAVGRFACDF